MRVLGDNLSTFTHWFALTMALIASVFFGFFLFGEDIPALMKGQNIEIFWFIPGLLIAMTGTFCTFWKKTTGAILMIAGAIAMALYFYFLSGWKDANMMIAYGLPYILPGFLLLVVKK
jgi:hypothetical protein